MERYECRVENGVRLHSVAGDLALEDVREAIRQLARAAGDDPVLDSLVDVTAVTGIGFDTIEMAGLRLSPEPSPGGRKRKVAVVVSNELVYGYCRAFENMTVDELEVAIFVSTLEARAWLGLDR